MYANNVSVAPFNNNKGESPEKFIKFRFFPNVFRQNDQQLKNEVQLIIHLRMTAFQRFFCSSAFLLRCFFIRREQTVKIRPSRLQIETT